MGHDPRELGRRIKDARGKTSQEVIGSPLGISQPQWSLIESGRFDFISKSKLLAICQTLGLEASDYLAVKEQEQQVLSFCPNEICRTQKPVLLGNQVIYQPLFVSTYPARASYCRICGAHLCTACPSCAALLVKGCACSHCGHLFIKVTVSPQQVYDKELLNQISEQRADNEAIIKDIFD